MSESSLSRREFLRYASGAIAASAAAACGRIPDPASIERRPNVVFVFADQMRFSAMGCAGNPDVKTPNLDRMAEQGLFLENAFSCSPVCSPYRAQLMTGRYGNATGVIRNDIQLPSEETTLAEVLKRAGYATGYIGKWHLNAGRRSDAPLLKAGYVPPEDRQGWDYWAALECSHNYYKTKYYGDGPEPIAVNGYEPDLQTDLAIKFMRANTGRPFCLMLSYGPPHNPYKPPMEYDVYDPEAIALRPNVPKALEAKARRDIARYYGLITSLDDNIGRLMAAMDEMGVGEDTVFCFSSDHGDMLHSQGERLKQRPWDESIHVPFILRYPRRIESGRRRDTLFGSVDVMPTLLGFCGAPIPADVQGLDLSSLFLGESDEEPESVFFTITHHGGGPGRDWRGVRTKKWSYALDAEGPWTLYDLDRDPYEQNNLAHDSEYVGVREKLGRLIADWREETGDAAVLRILSSKKTKKARQGSRAVFLRSESEGGSVFAGVDSSSSVPGCSPDLQDDSVIGHKI